MMLDEQEQRWIYSLYRLGRVTGEAAKPSIMWRHLLENIVHAFKASSGCLAETQNVQGRLKIQAGIGLPEGVVGSEMAAGAGILGLVVLEGKPRLLNGNLSQDQKLADRLPQRRGPPPWSAMCWPLIIEDRILGAISVNRVQGVEAFSENDLERGRQLIEFISLAVENMQLNLKLHQQLADLKEENQALHAEVEKLRAPGN